MDFDNRYQKWTSSILARKNIDHDYCISLAKEIVYLENFLLSLGPPNYKEAPLTSITTRHEYYNLLDLIDTKLLNEQILDLGNKILGGEEFYVKMWANIFRNGEKIDRHMHHASPIIVDDNFKNNVFKTVCGNLFLFGDAPSETVYHFEGPVAIPNITGDIHIFSCTVEHETKPYKGKLRIGIAFDIYTKNFFSDLNSNTPENLRLISRKNV